MHRPPSKRIRWTLALLFGVPGTAMYLSLATFSVFYGFQSAADAIQGGPWSYSSPPSLMQGLFYVAWGFAGVRGLLGFWVWITQPRWLNQPAGKWLVASLLIAGIAAMVAFAAALLWLPPEVSVWSAFAVLSVSGISIIPTCGI